MAYWFLPEMGELFMKLWLRYLSQLAMVKRNHPFAFVNLRGGTLGEPYSLSKYHEAHAAAIERIGLTPSKALGTTPHGHRHAYGNRLMRAGVPSEMRRRLMHHVSLFSQEIYTRPTREQALRELSSAGERLRAIANDRVGMSV